MSGRDRTAAEWAELMAGNRKEWSRLFREAVDGGLYLDDADSTVWSPEEIQAYIGLRIVQEMVYTTAVDSGWHHDIETGAPLKVNFGERVALMHSELSEALEAHRKDLPDDKLNHRNGVEVELADVLIRVLDTGAAMGIDVAGALIEKNRFNRKRQDHKPENRRKANGKKY